MQGSYSTTFEPQTEYKVINIKYLYDACDFPYLHLISYNVIVRKEKCFKQTIETLEITAIMNHVTCLFTTLTSLGLFISYLVVLLFE